jgi:hypothetical protein
MIPVVNGWDGSFEDAPDMVSLDDLLLHLADEDGNRLYAVVDAARDDQVMIRLAEGEASFQSLFQGTGREALFAEGPVLVACEKGLPLFSWLTGQAWGTGCGFFLTSKAPHDLLTAHLQQCLKVITQDDRELFFRYYDPRVLRTYLPSCDPKSGWRFMGPVERMLMESEFGDRLLSFRRKDLGPEPADGDPVWRQPLFISAAQLQLFSDTGLERFKGHLKAHLSLRFRSQIEALAPAQQDLDRLVKDGMDRARMYGLRSEFDVQRYVEYMLLLGPDFDLDTDYAWAARILFAADASGREKMDRLDRAAVLRLLEAGDRAPENGAAGISENSQPDREPETNGG